MKAKLFVVNDETLEEAKLSKIAKIKVPLAKKENNNEGDEEDDEEIEDPKKPSVHFVQSTDSMLADMLQLSLGDYVFFWCEKKKDLQKSTITGVYRIVSKPFFQFDNESDIFPFKVCIEEAYHFNNPVTEYEVLNSPFINTALWNIAGKKISGKGRGSVQLTQKEAEALLQLLIAKNPDYKYKPDYKVITKYDDKSLCIDYSKKGEKLSRPENNHIFEYDMLDFVHFKRRGKLHYEKSYEAIFNYEINRNNRHFLSQLGIKDNEKIIWFGNYLPYSLDATEMDYLIFTSIDGENVTGAYVIEFKTKELLPPDRDTHFQRAIQYSQWVDENLLNGAKITQPILICEKCPDFENPAEEEEIVRFYNELEERGKDLFNVQKRVKIFESDFSGNQPLFIKKR